MKNILILQDGHKTSLTTDYLRRADNINFFRQSIFGFEQFPHHNKLVPFTSLELMALAMMHANPKQERDISGARIFTLLKNISHQRVYPIDCVFGTAPEYLLTIKLSQEPVIQHLFGGEAALLTRSIWFRDRDMAKTIEEIAQTTSTKDIVIMVGATHYGIIYHLLNSPHADNYNIKLVSFAPQSEWVKKEEGAEHFYGYYQQYPVSTFSISEADFAGKNIKNIPSLSMIATAPKIRINLESKQKFSLNFVQYAQQANSKLDAILRELKEAVKKIGMVDSEEKYKQKRAEMEPAARILFRLFKALESVLPPNPLLGSELSPAEHPFLIKHFDQSQPPQDASQRLPITHNKQDYLQRLREIMELKQDYLKK